MIPPNRPDSGRPSAIAGPSTSPPTATLPLPRSQYLADALDQLQQTAPREIRTPMALGADLLADALLQHGLFGKVPLQPYQQAAITGLAPNTLPSNLDASLSDPTIAPTP